jgi:hypothetical protein
MPRDDGEAGDHRSEEVHVEGAPQVLFADGDQSNPGSCPALLTSRSMGPKVAVA